jgi:AcrR family transcriptional regulator
MTVESPTRGRPRSDVARLAVLHAVDDLLVEQGYAAMTMRGIAERAGVGRQTVYRWWSTKAEILLEAVAEDAGEELRSRPCRDARKDLVGYLGRVGHFLTEAPAGLAYRALLGEAQHDPAVRELLGGAVVLSPTAHAVLERHRAGCPSMPTLALATDQLLGPALTRVLLGRAPLAGRELGTHVDCLLRAWGGRYPG